MNPAHMYGIYAQRAQQATCPICRTVNMLGMMCASAVRDGGIFAFVGKGYGGDWPNPAERAGESLSKTQDLRRPV